MNKDNINQEMIQAKLQEYILNIPIGAEVNLEVLLRIILQLTDIKHYNAKETAISQVEEILHRCCNSGIIKKKEKRVHTCRKATRFRRNRMN